ncbi:PREDICTED: HLA class II histocompatibility antigen, DRB1-8 beta chain-like [Gekko japonicus]|uniref:HLA class II histocompatibility antigen, DRB1-8 beta chain-like n=1 Tax=Gekko japonicus TaxID=146911 RepID=A0ABM1K5I9_GEKJA|nr:PREDICTED: HLA class II histocompatibility antigen, DRB1-8 beta chain-like [Gekko japonicus]
MYNIAHGATCSIKEEQEDRYLFYANRTAGEVRFLERYIYSWQEFVPFNSSRRSYEAVTELGEPGAHCWNSQKEWMEYMQTQVDTFCCHNYRVQEGWGITLARKEG